MDSQHVPQTAFIQRDVMQLYGEEELDAMFDDVLFPGHCSPDIFSTVQCKKSRSWLHSEPKISSSIQHIWPNTVIHQPGSQGNILRIENPNEAAIQVVPVPQAVETVSLMENTNDQIREPTKPKPAQKLSCSLCPNENTSTECLEDHMMFIHERKLQSCDKCSSTFRSTCALRWHIRKFHTKDLACSICKKTFGKTGPLLKHLKHCEKRPFKCHMCNSCFVFEPDLLFHQSLHSTQSFTQCTLCNKSYATPQGLRLHMRKHSGFKPFKCVVCKKSFTDGSFLKEHMLKHTGGLDLNCEICGKKFSSRQGRRHHMKSHAM